MSGRRRDSSKEKCVLLVRAETKMEEEVLKSIRKSLVFTAKQCLFP